MRLFRRISDIVAANLNDLVDRFEDPEVMLKQAIREMETMIGRATAGAARAIASDRLLGKDLAEHDRQAGRWHAIADESVVCGDDDLARQAIARAHEHEDMARALAEHQSCSRQTAQALRDQISAMRAKHAEAGRKLASLSASRQVAVNGRALRGIALESSGRTNGFTRFQKLQAKIDQAEAEAQALFELDEQEGWNPGITTDSLERGRRIEAHLAAIKKRFSESQETIG
jgi:phage shock protein A